MVLDELQRGERWALQLFDWALTVGGTLGRAVFKGYLSSFTLAPSPGEELPLEKGKKS